MLGNGADHAIYPGDDIVSADKGGTGRPNMALGGVVDGEFVDPAGDGAREGQLRSGTLRAFHLGCQDVGERAPGSCHLREVAKDNGVAGGGLDLQDHLRREKDTGVGCHQVRQNDRGDPPTRHTNCRICTLACPPGVSSSSRF